MVTIEHDFDATVITLVDEGPAPLREDVTITAGEDGATVAQWDPETDRILQIRLSPQQIRDLRAALDLPEGMYRARPKP